MPRKPPPQVCAEMIHDCSRNTEQQLNALYIRMVKRQLLESSLTAEQKKEVLKALNRTHREKN